MRVERRSRVTPIRPVHKVTTAADKPRLFEEPIKVILQTPGERARQSVSLSSQVGSRLQRQRWLQNIGVTDVPAGEIEEVYFAQLRIQREIAGYRK